MELAINHITPLIVREDDGKSMPAIVVATVEGDIHDIGKNLVVLMLRNYGFPVIDLGNRKMESGYKNLCFISRKKHRLIREAGERVPTGDRWSVG